MKISDVSANRILLKAGTVSEWDCCDFAVINCDGWKERIDKWLGVAASFEAPEELISLRFYDNCVDFYTSREDETGILPEGQEWAFIQLEEGEEDTFDRPETYLEAASLVLYPSGSGFYKAYGKYTNEEFYTAEISLTQILEQMEGEGCSL